MPRRDSTRALLCAVGLQFVMATAAQTADAPNPQIPAKTTPAIPWDQIGAKAGADYHGDGLCVAATAEGARLHCVFQRLDGEATAEGLWLVSTVTNRPGDRFRVMATAVGRRREARSPHESDFTVGGIQGSRGRSPSRCGTVTVDWPERAVHARGAGGGILREHGRCAAGFCGIGKAEGPPHPFPIGWGDRPAG